MDNENLLIICRSCGRKVLMHNMRLDHDKENMICIDCYNKKPAPTGLFKKNVNNTPYEPQKVVKKESKSEKMVKYICTNCKYKFSRKESQHVEKCPYCGRNTIVTDAALGADTIIKQSVDKKFDW